jgi:hypothetical protein
MKTIHFIDDITGEEVVFAILSGVQYKEDGYILAIEESEYESDEATAYVLKATYMEGDDIIYEIVDDQTLLDVVFPMLENSMDDFEN